MAPPFFAYYAVATNETEIIRSAVMQCLLYREVLKPNVSSNSVSAGAWQHIIRSKSPDLGLWSTSNGWAAMGMARVLATFVHWPATATSKDALIAQADLFTWIGEIIRAAMSSPMKGGLLLNYLNDTTWFGETSGTALLTATVYRLAVLEKEASVIFHGTAPKKLSPIVSLGDILFSGIMLMRFQVTGKMLQWADINRKTVAKYVDNNGIVKPAVNPLGWDDRTPYTKGSPEGQSFAVMLYAAWRDCVNAGICQK